MRILLALSSVLLASAKVYQRCELGLELLERHGFPQEHISTWLCITFWESRYNTSARHLENWDGSGDHGLFQINDRYWCNTPGVRSANVCKISCDKFRDDDITDDVECVKKILGAQGFRAWVAYTVRCRGDPTDYYAECRASRRSLPTVQVSPKTVFHALPQVILDPKKGLTFQLKPPETTIKFGHKDFFRGWFKIRPFFSATKYVSLD